MTQPDPAPEFGDRFTRRQVLRGALAGAGALGAGGLLAGLRRRAARHRRDQGSPPTGDAKLSHGGSMSVGATGGGSTDTLDAHVPVTDPDIMRNWNLYESLAVRSPDFKSIDYLVAESIEPEHAGNASSWIVTLRQGVEFHNGKTVAPEDVIFSLQRILDPKDPKTGASSIGYIDAKSLKQVGSRPGPDPAEGRQRRVRRRDRPVLQRDRPGRL